MSIETISTQLRIVFLGLALIIGLLGYMALDAIRNLRDEIRAALPASTEPKQTESSVTKEGKS